MLPQMVTTFLVIVVFFQYDTLKLPKLTTRNQKIDGAPYKIPL